MYFVSLELENIKCFGQKQILSLCDEEGNLAQWTLILGDNGVGKTTLLKCLAWMTPVYAPLDDAELASTEIVGNDQKPVPDSVKPAMDDFDDETEFEQLIRDGRNVISEAKGTFVHNAILGAKPEKESMVSVGMHFEKKAGKLEVADPIIGKLAKFNPPHVYAYGASRHMGYNNFDQSGLENPLANLFSGSGDLYDAQQVLVNLEFASLKEGRVGKSSELLAKLRRLLADILPDVSSPEAIVINSPIDERGNKTDVLVEVDTPYGRVPLNNLSLGYQTMLAWSVDLALHMFWNNPEAENPLAAPAIVIVDEIDLHLHPKWQRIIRKYLSNHFSKTQFICTAHSPFMAQSAEMENLCVLNQKNGEVFIENEPDVVTGWRIGQVVTSDLFGIQSERSPEYEELINKRRIILDKTSRSPDEEAQLKLLDEQLLALPIVETSEDQKLLDVIRNLSKNLNKDGNAQ